MALIDVETDGLYLKATKIHVLSYTLAGEDPKSIFDYDEMREFLLSQRTLIGHNLVRFDVPVLEKLLGIKITAKLYDTLPICWYVDHDRQKHGLESYGEDFNVPKPKVEDWHNLTPEEYAHRCQEDVKINWRLWVEKIKYLKLLYKDREKLDKFLQYLTFKMQCAAHQELVGWNVDLDRVNHNIEELTKLQEEKVEELRGVMPNRKVYAFKEKPKKFLKNDGTPSKKGEEWLQFLDEVGLDRVHEEPVRYVKKEEPPNPNSSDQVKDWLFSLGWKPCTFDYKTNDDGTERQVPQVRKDGELTPSVQLLIEENPHVKVLEGLTVIQHRLSIFEGFRDCAHNGKLRAEVAGLTNTLRFKHSKPLVNLPGVDKPWGEEIRGCLIAPKGELLCGADMVSLEDTTRRHYIQPLDPEYVWEQSQPGYDPHLALAVKAGTITRDEYEFYKWYKNKND